MVILAYLYSPQIVLSIRIIIFLFLLQVVARVCSLMHQQDILLERLKVAEGMRAFISHRMSGAEELRVRLE